MHTLTPAQEAEYMQALTQIYKGLEAKYGKDKIKTMYFDFFLLFIRQRVAINAGVPSTKACNIDNY